MAFSALNSWITEWDHSLHFYLRVFIGAQLTSQKFDHAVHTVHEEFTYTKKCYHTIFFMFIDMGNYRYSTYIYICFYFELKEGY